ncbi:MAG: hypothetical protein Q7V88_09085 [Actinomycetota bacterium]|nr:hypothetical protein [Actinomycetota bacterium]
MRVLTHTIEKIQPSSGSMPADLFEQVLAGHGLTRRQVFQLCELAGLAAAATACGGDGDSATSSSAATSTTAGATTSTVPATSTTAAPPTTEGQIASTPPPTRAISTKWAPFDDAGTEEREAGLYSSATGSADKFSGNLDADAYAKVSSGAQGAAASAEAWVRWSYTHPSSAPLVRAAPQLAFTTDTGEAAIASDAENGGGSYLVVLFSRVIDTTDGTEVRFPVRREGAARVLNLDPLTQSHDFEQACGVVFQPGHAYRIDALLTVRADVFSAAGVEVTAYHGPSGGGNGEASKSYSATVQSITLVTMEPPWVRTMIKSLFEPARDTYDSYEEALADVSGRGYFEAGAQVELAAGGSFQPGLSSITITALDAKIVQLRNCPLSYAINAAGDTAVLTLPPPALLPLEGKTWRFVVVLDPEYLTVAAGRSDIAVPVFRPWFDMMLDLEVAAQAQRASRPAGVGPSVDAGPAAGIERRGTTVSAQEFFNPSHWCLALPASQFRALTATDGRSTMPEYAQPLPVLVYTPADVAAPEWNDKALAVTVEPMPTWAPRTWQFSTEPWVIVTILDLWNIFYWSCAHPVVAEFGMELCANPEFVQLLQRVGESSEDYRRYLDGLYWLTPVPGVAIKLTDLPETLTAGLTSGGPLYVNVAGVLVPLVVFLSRRLRRFIRHVVVLDTLQTAWAAVRPRQQHTLTLAGHVSNGTLDDDDFDQHTYTVLMDYVPALQPWSLQEPIAL